MTTRVLFVCLGNICRSPMAEGVFAALARAAGFAVETDSAGTGDWHAGDPPYPPAIRAAAARGYDISGQRARQVRREDFDRFDLILTMDAANLGTMERLRPDTSRAELRPLLSYAKETGRGEVPDPYYTGDFEEALDLIEAGARGVLASMRP